MSFQTMLKEKLKGTKFAFEGFAIDTEAKDSKLHINITIKSSVDFPGDQEVLIDSLIDMLFVGKLQSSSDKSDG